MNERLDDVLTLFVSTYGQIPEWVATFAQWLPDALVAYTDLRLATLNADGALTRKEKELLLVGVNAARRYDASMLLHTKGAVEHGATAGEIAEMLLAMVLSRGLPAWLTGVKAIDYARELTGGAAAADRPEAVEPWEGTAAYLSRTFTTTPMWAEWMGNTSRGALDAYLYLRSLTLRDGLLPRKLKELALYCINLVEMYPEGVKIHADGARQSGATTGELAEAAGVMILTGGIPSWFGATSILAERTGPHPADPGEAERRR